jgi:hypothetical protein
MNARTNSSDCPDSGVNSVSKFATHVRNRHHAKFESTTPVRAIRIKWCGARRKRRISLELHQLPDEPISGGGPAEYQAPIKSGGAESVGNALS